MAITIQKAKPKAVVENKLDAVLTTVSLTPDEMSYEQLADSYGQLNDELEAKQHALEPIKTKLSQVTKVILGKLEQDIAQDEGVSIDGDHWILDISACKKKNREIKNIALIQKFLGAEVFAQIAKVNISDLEKYLTPDQLIQVINEDTGFTSTRKIDTKFLG